MRRSTVALGALAAGLLLAGCGSLRVKVDVLEPAVVESELDRLLLRDSLPGVLAQSDEALKARFDDLQNAHYGLVAKLVAEYQAEASTLGGAAGQGLARIAQGLNSNFSATRGPFYRREHTEVAAINGRIRRLNQKLASDSAADRPATLAALVVALRERQIRLENVDKVVRDDVGSLLERSRTDLPRVADARTAVAKDVAQSAGALHDARKSLIAGQGIVESPYAYAVAAAADEKWSPRFNEAFGTGQLGNLNVAIKMVDLGDFTLKGLTFDPSDVVRAISKMTVQSLVLAAQLSGVPIKPPSVGGAQPATGGGAQPAAAGTALADSSARLAAVQEAAALRDARLQDYRSALVTIGLAIIREQPKLAGTDAERKAAIDAIAATYGAHKPRLNLGPLQGGTR
ncbi:MAG: hypothetical protein HYU41_25450 [Candidatus Rokubacteria bacterium]|nr:hypothetical protein [Candidatus Rokubacteria bacterium]